MHIDFGHRAKRARKTFPGRYYERLCEESLASEREVSHLYYSSQGKGRERLLTALAQAMACQIISRLHRQAAPPRRWCQFLSPCTHLGPGPPYLGCCCGGPLGPGPPPNCGGGPLAGPPRYILSAYEAVRCPCLPRLMTSATSATPTDLLDAENLLRSRGSGGFSRRYGCARSALTLCAQRFTKPPFDIDTPPSNSAGRENGTTSTIPSASPCPQN